MTLRNLVLAAVLAAACSPASAGTLALQPAQTHVFKGVVDDDSVRDALQAFAKMPSRNVTLVLDSPGGYVDSGLKLVTGMQLLQSQGYTFRCLVTGMAASMAFGVLAECNTRYALPFSGLLWHPIRVSYRGAITTQLAAELAEMLEYYEAPFRARIQDQIKVDADWFYLHWYRETMHPGRTLAAMAPSFITEVSGATGMPMSSLLWIPEPRGFFDDTQQDTYTPDRRLVWIAPGFEYVIQGAVTQ